MNNLIEDLSTLTTIPDKAIAKLIDKSYYSINATIAEAIANNQEIVDIDIGIGILKILLNSESVKYKFIPNSKLENQIKKTVISKQNLLEVTLEKTLVDKFINIYKDFM